MKPFHTFLCACNALLLAALLFGPATVFAADPPLPERKPAPGKETSQAKDDSEKDEKKQASAEPKPNTWSKEEIAAAKKQCAALLDNIAIDYEPADPIRHGSCGAPAPILLKSIGKDPAVKINPPATVRCPMAAAFGKWVEEVVQPEARELYHAPVVKMQNAASYDCRNRYGKKEGKLSEHALANALDISIFTLQSKRQVALLGSWPPGGRLASDVALANLPKTMPLPIRNPALLAAAKAEAKLLGLKGPKLEMAVLDGSGAPGQVHSVSLSRHAGEQVLEVMKARIEPETPSVSLPDETPAKEKTATLEPTLKIDADADAEFMVHIHTGACKYFGTVLGPEANAAHKAHFHFDMIERNRSYCQ